MSLLLFLAGAGLVGAGIVLCYLLAKAALFIAVLSAAALVGLRLCLAPSARKEMGYEPLVIATGMPVAAWLLPSIWLLYAAMVLLVPVMARRAGQAPALYLFALLLLPGLDTSIAIGSLKLFSFGVHDALAFGAALSLLMHPSWRATARPALDAPFLALLLLLVVAVSRNTSLTNMLRVAVDVGFDCALPYYVVSRGVRDREDVQRCLLHLAAGAAVLSVVLFYEARNSWPIYMVLLDQYGIIDRPIVKTRGGVMRAGGPFLESTSAAMTLVFCFLAAWMARPAFRSTLHHLALLGLLALGLVMPQSRGAWVGLITGMVTIDLYRGRLGQTAMRLGAVGLIGLGLFAAARSSPEMSETLGMSGGSADTTDYREQLLSRGLEELRDSPLIGFSYPELLIRLDDMRQGEGIVDFVNTHLFIALLSGLLGLVIFNGTFLSYIAHVWRARRRSRREGDASMRASAFVFAALVTPLQMLAFTSLGGRVQVFMFVFFALAAVVARAGKPAAAALSDAGQPAPAPNSPPSFAFARNPSAAPAAPAASSSASSRGSSSPIRYSANQP